METKFQRWVSKEMSWMGAYRKKTMHQLTHVTTPLVVGCLTVFFCAMALLGGATVTDVIYTGICGIVLGAIIMGLVILVVRAGVADSRMQKGIQRAVKLMGLSEAEAEQLAAEMLEAAGNREQELVFAIQSPANNNALPGSVTVTEHFAYMKGDSPLVNIIRRADIDHIETSEEERQTTKRGAKIKTYYTFLIYSINFVGKDGKSPGGFSFFDEQLRNKVLGLL